MAEKLDPQDFTRQRDEASKEGVRGLLIINGGGAVALLAFLQAIWPKYPLLSGYVVFGIAVLALGVLCAGLAPFLRYHASYNAQKQNRGRWLGFRRAYISCWYISLGLFIFGIAIVIFGVFKGGPVR